MKTYFFTSHHIKETKTIILKVYEIMNDSPKYINLVESHEPTEEMKDVIDMLYEYGKIDESTHKRLLEDYRNNLCVLNASGIKVYDLDLI